MYWRKHITVCNIFKYMRFRKQFTCLTFPIHFRHDSIHTPANLFFQITAHNTGILCTLYLYSSADPSFIWHHTYPNHMYSYLSYCVYKSLTQKTSWSVMSHFYDSSKTSTQTLSLWLQTRQIPWSQTTYSFENTLAVSLVVSIDQNSHILLQSTQCPCLHLCSEDPTVYTHLLKSIHSFSFLSAMFSFFSSSSTWPFQVTCTFYKKDNSHNNLS